MGLPGGTSGKELSCQFRRLKRPGFYPGSGRCPGEGNSNQLQYSCLENPMDRGAWQAIYSPWGCKSWTRLGTKSPPPSLVTPWGAKVRLLLWASHSSVFFFFSFLSCVAIQLIPFITPLFPHAKKQLNKSVCSLFIFTGFLYCSLLYIPFKKDFENLSWQTLFFKKVKQNYNITIQIVFIFNVFQWVSIGIHMFG